jgi:Transposase IS66 family.
MKENRIDKDCEACLKRFESINADLQKQIKEQSLIVQKQAEKLKKLEEQLNKNSHNSNKPPSSDNPFKKRVIQNLRKKSGKKQGGQFGHKGTTLKKVENPDKIENHHVKKCSCCGLDISSEPIQRLEKRQVFDIPIEVEVTEHRAEVKDCPNCGERVIADFPEGVTNNTQYGKNLKAHMVFLKVYEMIPYERLAEYTKFVLGVPISKAGIEGFIHETFNKLEEYDLEVIERILKELVLHCDETGLRIEGFLKWLHVASNERFTYYFPHDKRGVEAMRAMDILTRFEGIIIHDGWKSYLDFLCRHGLCNVHHLRELIYMHEEMGQEWAKEMGDLLIKIKNDKEESYPIPTERIMKYDEEYDRIIEKGYVVNPMPEIQDEIVKRGRKKRGKVLCLLDRLKEYKESVLLFMREKDVPFGNNQAERDIRMMKVQQKISGTFRSWFGAKAFCRIRGYISTVKKQGGNVYQALVDALNGSAIKYAAG